MKLTATYTQDDVTVNLRASMIEQDLYLIWAELFEDEDKALVPRFDAFLFVASAIKSITGLEWNPPHRHTSFEDMCASYEIFMGQVNMAFMTGLQETLNSLYGTSANVVEKHDEALTADEKKTAT